MPGGQPVHPQGLGQPDDVTAVFSGSSCRSRRLRRRRALQTPPAAVNPSLTHVTDGVTTTFTGTGFNPNSEVTSRSRVVDATRMWVLDLGVVATTDASGSWSYTYTEDCVFGEPYSGRRRVRGDSRGTGSVGLHVCHRSVPVAGM